MTGVIWGGLNEFVVWNGYSNVGLTIEPTGDVSISGNLDVGGDTTINGQLNVLKNDSSETRSILENTGGSYCSLYLEASGVDGADICRRWFNAGSNKHQPSNEL